MTSFQLQAREVVAWLCRENWEVSVTIIYQQTAIAGLTSSTVRFCMSQDGSCGLALDFVTADFKDYLFPITSSRSGGG